MEQLENVKINFDSQGLWMLNIVLAVVLFGVALGISNTDFNSLLKRLKQVLVGVLAQFMLWPLLIFLIIALSKNMDVFNNYTHYIFIIISGLILAFYWSRKPSKIIEV